MNKKAIKRVARGAALLDRTLPGWEHNIDLQRLNLALGTDCVLGQVCEAAVLKAGLKPSRGVFNGYDTLTEDRAFCITYPSTMPILGALWDVTIGMKHEDLVKHGFFAESAKKNPVDWEDLDAAWTALVKERFDSGALSGIDDEEDHEVAHAQVCEEQPPHSYRDCDDYEPTLA